MPAFDPADVVGFLRRQELRAALRTMDAGQRAILLANDPAFADAMLEQPPSLSGLVPDEAFIVEATRKERLAGLHGPVLAEIESLEETVKEADAIFDLALVDLKLHSEMDDRTFTEFSTPIMNRKNAPWLIKDGRRDCSRSAGTERHGCVTSAGECRRNRRRQILQIGSRVFSGSRRRMRGTNMTTAQRTQRFEGVVLNQRSPTPQSTVPMTLEAVIGGMAPATFKRASPGHAPGPGSNPSGKVKRPRARHRRI